MIGRPSASKKARKTYARTFCVLALLAVSQAAFPSRPSEQALNALGEAYRQAQQPTTDTASRVSVVEHTAANGLQLNGTFTYLLSGGTATVTVDAIQNASTTRTT